MERVDCLICNGPTDGAEAAITPFLLKYCGINETTTEIRYCPECDFAFFKRRLTDAEATRLYTDYRGAEYNRVRLEVEPSYSYYVALFSDALSEDFVSRIRDYNYLIDVYPELAEFRNVLDFGGNGFIPARVFRNAKIWIDDLNAGSTDENARKHEFIFATMVFEHLSDPVPLLKSLAQRMHPEGMIFIDVPAPPQASVSEGFLWQRKHGGEMYVMHEHINFFSKRSLGRLVRAAGLIPVFEYRARYAAQSVVAVFEDSEIARKLLPLKESRTLLYETKLARTLAMDASESTLRSSDAAANRIIEALSESIRLASKAQTDAQPWVRIEESMLAQNQHLSDLLAKSKETESALRQQIEDIYRSTSWSISVPVRVAGRAVKRLLGHRQR